MRRASDIAPDTRTGRGRRARDLLLCEEPPRQGRATDIDTTCRLLGDDLGEAALALGALERHLVAVHTALAAWPPDPDRLSALASHDRDAPLEALDDALASLGRGLLRLGDRVRGLERLEADLGEGVDDQ